MEPRINNGHQQAKKNSAVLMGDRINEGFFYKKMYGPFARRPKNGRNNEAGPYYQGGRKAGFHCT